MKLHINKTDFLQTCSSIFIAIIPLMAPYAIFGVSSVWSFGVLFILLVAIITKGKIQLKPNINYYFLLPLVTFILSLNGLTILSNTNNLINQLVGLGIISVIMLFLWNYAKIEFVCKYGNIVAYICLIFAIYQAFCVIKGYTVPTGKIEFLSFVNGQTWVAETWGFRMNSLFSEPSYFAMYLLPLIICNIMYNKNINAIVFSVGIILSSSTLGIIGLIIIAIWVIFIKNDKITTKIWKIFLFCFAILIGYYLLNNIPELNQMFSRSIDKLNNVSSSENNMRLQGYFDYFFKYNAKEMMFGVGISQFQNFFLQQNIIVSNYSNSIVMMFLQFGIVGFILSVFYYIYIGNVAKNHGAIIFFVILIMILAVDYVTFSYRYYFLLYFTLFYDENCIRQIRQEKRDIS